MPLKKLSKHTVLKGGTIIDPFNKRTHKADLWIKDGFIESIGEFDAPRSAQIIDCKDKIITHGFVIYMYIFGSLGGKIKKL